MELQWNCISSQKGLGHQKKMCECFSAQNKISIFQLILSLQEP